MRTRKQAVLIETLILLGVVALLIFAAPAFLSDFRLNLLGKFLALGIVALAIDLIWGYTGLLSLGHGVFFGLGAYCMAMYLKLEVGAASSGATSAYGSGTVLPDFMVWNGLTDLPWFWKPFQSFGFTLAMIVLVPATVAALLGILTFRNRIRGVYFSILTQAMALIFTTLFIGQQAYTGGTNGLTDFKTILGAPINDVATQHRLFDITVVVLAAVYIFCRLLTSGGFGRVLAAIRDDEGRLRFSGYDPAQFKVFVFAISAALAGIGGALFVPQVGIISPSLMGVVPSIEMVIWVAVGGRGTLIGAIIGAILVNSAKSFLSESFPDFWLYFQGSLFVAVVLLMPSGIVGTLAHLRTRRVSAPARGPALVKQSAAETP
ncbi:MAG TPA: urea ABC transporter permease subunit UrtC [Candidatus Acidoferrales bacterium]|nr:urea ABC transporter permease subunit UrtC [Candidatus Acidoferrales bacterium]